MIQKKGRLLVSITLLLLLFSCSTSIYASENNSVNDLFNKDLPQEGPTTDNIVVEDSPNFAFLLIRTVLVLGVIILLIYGLSKWISKRSTGIESTQFMKVQSGINLGQNKSLRLVKVGKSYYLLGVGNDVQLLKEFSSEEEIQEIEQFQQQQSEPLLTSSLKMWNQFRSKMQKKESSNHESFQTQLEERLLELRNPQLERKSHEKHHEREEVNE